MPASESPRDDAAPAFDPADAQRIEERLLWAERMESLAALTSGITHSLSNLLASTLMSVDLVLRTSPEGAHNQLLTSLQVMTRDSLEIVRQLMSIARGVEGKPIVFQAQYLIGEMQRLLHAFMPSVPIITEYPEDLWPLDGDPHRFVQLVLSLCLEARRGLPAGAAIVLSAANVEPDPAAAAEKHVAIQVEVREQPASPSAGPPARGESTAAASTTRSHPPGLWLVERPRCPAAALAVAAGGTFEVLLEPAGQGARIVLPAARMPEKAAELAGEPPRGDDARVVICEETPILAQALTEVLACHGYKPLVAPALEPPPGEAATAAMAAMAAEAPREPGQIGARELGRGIGPEAGGGGDIVLAAASLDTAGLWQLCTAAVQTGGPLVVMIDAATADRLERETPDRQRGLTPAAILRKPFTARDLLFALASGSRRAT